MEKLFSIDYSISVAILLLEKSQIFMRLELCVKKIEQKLLC